MNKDDVAAILEEIGVLLELKGENPFKTRAYANGARTLEGLAEPLETLVAEKTAELKCDKAAAISFCIKNNSDLYVAYRSRVQAGEKIKL